MPRTKNFRELRRQIEADPVRRARVQERVKKLEYALRLADVRKARDFTQLQIASLLDTTQSGVSRIEHQTDLYLSTLRSYIEAMGGRLELHAVFDDTVTPIDLTPEQPAKDVDQSPFDPDELVRALEQHPAVTSAAVVRSDAEEVEAFIAVSNWPPPRKLGASLLDLIHGTSHPPVKFTFFNEEETRWPAIAMGRHPRSLKWPPD